MTTTLGTAAELVARALLGHARALAGGDELLVEYVEELGWTLPEAPAALRELHSASAGLVASLAKLEAHRRQGLEATAPEGAAAQAAAELLLDLALYVSALRDLPAGLRGQLPPAFIEATRIDEEIQDRLWHDAIVRQVEAERPDLFLFGRLAGLFEVVERAADPEHFQPRFRERRIRWDRLALLGGGPAALMRDVYGWGTPTLDSEKLILALRDLSFSLLSPSFFDYAGLPLVRAVAPGLDETPPRERGLVLPLFTGTPLDVSVGLYPTPKRRPDELAGLMLALSGAAGGEHTLELGPSLFVDFSSTLDFAAGVALAFWPDQPPQMLGDIGGAPGGLIEGARARLGVRFAPAEQSERLALLSFAGLQLDARGCSIEAGLGMGAKDEAEVYVQAGLRGLRLRLGGVGQDSFLTRLLPESLALEFDLSFGWSRARGLYWQYGAGPNIRIRIGARLGPVALDSLDISFASSGGRHQVALGVTAAARLGPVLVRVEGLGAALAVDTRGGNLGLADLGMSPVPPRGVGLTIDAPRVSGGGFLFLESEKGQYAGVMLLTLEGGITIKALGLINTRLPGGAKGFSLLVIMTAEGFEPVPLGLGFKLTGIGGLIAVNRTFDEEVLRAGIRERTLDSVMFPPDPLRNAPQILSNLNRVFPPAEGHYLFGPVVQIAWGTPTLITMNLGVVLELGARLRLLVLGQVSAILPKPEHELVRLQLDAIGVLDFDQGTAALDAALYDSRLVQKFVLTGAMAMRLKWESPRNFALAVGGLHPAFNPPPNFPKLERIAINLSAGDNPRLRCEAYFAITSNTVQFGARAELLASAAGFSIHGEVGFDVLIQFDPFVFKADFRAQVQLKRGSRNLFKVKVEGAFSGPRPLHVRGKATFEILWWDVSVGFDKTLVGGERPPRPAPVSVLPILKEALGSPGNWLSALPGGRRQLVTLGARQGGPGEILLHPLGTLTVRQSAVPLDTPLKRFGPSPVAGPNLFRITGASLGGRSEKTEKVTDFFAPAQFDEMTDDAKLSSPSFEPMTAGVRFGSEKFSFPRERVDPASPASELNRLVAPQIAYETRILDRKRNVTVPSEREYTLPHTALLRQYRFGAAGASELRRAGRDRYRAGPGKYKIEREGWSVIATDDLSVQPIPGVEAGRPATYAEAVRAVRQAKRLNPSQAARLKVARPSELES